MYRLEIQPFRYGAGAIKKFVPRKNNTAERKISQVILTPEELANKIKNPTKKVEKRASGGGDYGDTCGMSYGDWLVTGISC